jgi:hypothetical protein
MRSVSTFIHTESCSNIRFKFHLSAIKPLGAVATFLLLVSGFSTPAFAQVFANITENTECVLEQPAYTPTTVNCTAGDLGLSTPVVDVIKACNYPGDIATLSIVVDITTTAQTRYDMGLWFSIDGDPNADGSRTGRCTVVTIPLLNLDTGFPLLNVDGVPVDIDGDVCGDVANATAGPPDITNANLGTFSLPCIDADGDGFIDVPLIVAYSNKSDPLNCNVPIEAVPESKPKCSENLNSKVAVPVPARIIVNKDTIPADAKLFDFTLAGPALDPVPSGGFDGNEPFQLADGDTFDTAVFTGGLIPGVYSVTETPDVDYTSSVVCDSDLDGPVADPTNISLQAGETVTCDVTNTLNGVVAIVKRTIGFPEDSIGDLVEIFDFDFTSTAGFDAPFMISSLATDLVGNGTGNFNNSGLPPAVYTITENPETGWQLTDLFCVGGDTTVDLDTGVATINLVGSETVTCTFENTELGSIIVDKVTNPPGAAQVFDFLTNYGGGSFSLADASTPNNSGPLLPSSEAVLYGVAEQPVTGWQETSAVCTGDVSGSKDPIALDLLPGETINCTFTNTKLVDVTLRKEWVGGVSGDIATLVADGVNGPLNNNSTSGGGDEIDTVNTVVLTTVIGETVTLSEAFVIGNVGDYTTSFICTGNTTAPTYTPGDTSATLLIDGADTAITCTYTNTILLTQLQLAKTWSGAIAGDAITAATTGLTNDASVASTSTGDNTDTGTAVQVFSGETATLAAEVFTIGDAANYTTSNWVCDDAAGSTVAAGGTLDITDADLGTTITCTVTNAIVDTQLVLAKSWSGAIAGDVITANTTGLTNNASLSSTSTGDNTEAGTAVAVFVGETATLAAEVFTIGDAANYTTSGWR